MTYPPDPYQRPQPYLVTKPGGLSGAAHAVHILVCLFTCGLWIPFYVLIAILAPPVRYEVAVPYGADPAAVQALQAQIALTPQQRARSNRRLLIWACVFVGPVAIIVLWVLVTSLAS